MKTTVTILAVVIILAMGITAKISIAQAEIDFKRAQFGPPETWEGGSFPVWTCTQRTAVNPYPAGVEDPRPWDGKYPMPPAMQHCVQLAQGRP